MKNIIKEDEDKLKEKQKYLKEFYKKYEEYFKKNKKYFEEYEKYFEENEKYFRKLAYNKEYFEELDYNESKKKNKKNVYPVLNDENTDEEFYNNEDSDQEFYNNEDSDQESYNDEYYNKADYNEENSNAGSWYQEKRYKEYLKELEEKFLKDLEEDYNDYLKELNEDSNDENSNDDNSNDEDSNKESVWDENIEGSNFSFFYSKEKKDLTYKDRIDYYQRETGFTEAIQTGIGQINSIPIAIGLMDFNFMGGSMGSVVGEKITRLIEYATNEFLPLIIICASGGARMQEGILSLMQMAKISSALYNYQSNKKLLYIVILASPTTGGITASFGMLGDIIIAEPNACIAFAGKRIIESILHITVPNGIQESEHLFDKGAFDLIVPRNLLKKVLSELFKFHNLFPFSEKFTKFTANKCTNLCLNY
uniref:Acetyl-coenzyme A carboxylase carboxyl transferase subunit beta, chloroplastic n=1 Tax=Diphelypaea coccinea TaxID=223087 RepID=A0A514TNB6_9LAMI|nr:acetyl-CoA carboxylase beta subunit [Diphelypaea coccinea]QDJ93995.1 acetyl-CoA carboxylase beta subunit [Diphelypaea coccinea]